MIVGTIERHMLESHTMQCQKQIKVIVLQTAPFRIEYVPGLNQAERNKIG